MNDNPVRNHLLAAGYTNLAAAAAFLTLTYWQGADPDLKGLCKSIIIAAGAYDLLLLAVFGTIGLICVSYWQIDREKRKAKQQLLSGAN